MQNYLIQAIQRKITFSACRWLLTLTIALLAMPSFAAPIAVDDNVAVPSNTTVFANDLAANDVTIPTDTYTITVAPTNGIATVSSNGLLDYTPNIGFASLDSLTYSIDDGAGGVDTATVTFDVVLTSDFLTPGSNFIIGQEDIPTPLNLTVDESLEYGGTLQDIIGVDALYRAEDSGGTAVASTIPSGSTGINITGYATRNVDTNQVDGYNDDYEFLTVSVNLREGTYSGRLTYSIDPGYGTMDQYTWLNVPLGQSVLSDSSYASGNWSQDAAGNATADVLIELVSGQILITETIPLQIAYHLEYMTSDGDSADFVSGSGDVQTPGDSQSAFAIPAELEPTDGSSAGYLVLTGNSAANGAHFRDEHKGFSRMVVNLETSTVSGVIASERGELDSLVTTWSFVDYPLVDLRDTPTALPVAITASTATQIGDTTAPGSGSEDDPTIYIDAAGALIVERATDHANAFTSMYTIENYQRTGLSSIASFVGVVSDTSLFDASPVNTVDETDNNKLVNLQTFAVPASSSIGLVQMSWQTIGGDPTNENVGYGFAVIDLTENTSSGSITFSRSTTPDLLAWQGVPIGTTMFGATDGGIALYQSNKTAGNFVDQYPETAVFSLEDNADGSRTLKFEATSNGNGAFRDYVGTTQVSWLGSEPFSVEGVPANGTLSHGSPTDSGGWEVDFADIPLLTISTNEHGTGELQLDLLLSSTGETDSIIVHVQPVVDEPLLTASDVIGYVGNPVALGISVGDSADIDGSETQLQTLTLSGVPTTVTLSASAGTVINFGGGNWQVDSAALATLAATGPSITTATVTVSGTNTDTHDLDGDGVIEDSNNGAGVDELDTVVYQDTFELSIREVPTVTSQTTNTGTPIISGTAAIDASESLSVTVNGITYTDGDGNLVSNVDGTWNLTIPNANTIADGTYAVTATLSHIDGGSGLDTTADELIIDATPPVIPTVNPIVTSDATPIIAGTATVDSDETLAVTVDGITYTAGDGNLIDNGDGTWILSISTPLLEGLYDVTTTVTDAAGNTSTDTTLGELTVEATPLSTPTVVPLTTSNTTPTITGNAIVESGNTFTVTVYGVTYVAGDGNLVHNSTGTWTLTIPTPMADNTYEVIATITDIFGNQYPDTSSGELVVDTIAPVSPTVISQITSNTTPILSGTATVGSGETLTVTVDGITYTAGDGDLIDNGDGTWDLNIPAPLAGGTYSVTATVTDIVGNAATDSSIDELIIDTVPPTVPTVSFQTTSNATPIISGTASIASGETLSVSVSGITYTAGDGNLVDNGDGTWDLTIPTALADGNYSVTATVLDAAGNSSIDATALELTIDTVAPVTPTVATQNTNSTSPTITGTATVAAGDTLSITVDGVTYVAGDGYLVDNGDGTWALSIPVPLVQGTYDVTTTVTDAAGNATNDTTAGELIIDLTAPVAPGVTSLATIDATPVIEGTATLAPGETLTVEVNGVIYTAGDGDLVDNGSGTWALTIPATNILAEDLYQVIATVTDAAGNSAVDPGVDDLLVDFTVPLTPGVTSLTTNNTTPIIEGTAIIATGETLTVNVDGITYTAGDSNLVDNTDGTWTLSVPTPMVEGVYDVFATIIDGAGNSSSDPSSNELLIDTTLPIAPSVIPQFTANTTPVIEGTANPGPGETLTVKVDGITYTVGDGNLIDNGNGTWALSIPLQMAEGTYEVLATVYDAAGNISMDATLNELVIDTTDPVIPTVNTLITNINSPVLTGTTSSVAGESLSVTVNGISYLAGDGNLVVNSNGTWDLTVPAANVIADGSYEVIATITDLTGNTSTDTSAVELTIDTGAPVIPTVIAQNTSNPTPIISGTAAVAVGETLTVIVDGVTYTAGDGNLVDNGNNTWDLTVPTPLTDSTYPITVTVVDAAGNASNDATTAELIIDTTAPITPTVVSQIISNATPTITGTATVAADENLTVTVDGITYTTAGGYLIDNGNGTWILNVPTPMADNNYNVTATVNDIAGNSVDDTTTSELIIDTTTPAMPTVIALITSDTTPDIQGTATIATGETLTVTVGGITYTVGDGWLVDNADGTWDLSIPIILADGTYEVVATITDTAGNTSTDTDVNDLIIDSIPPVTPTVTAQNTNSTSPTITGTATVAAGDTLSVTVDGVTYVAGDGYLVDNGDGTWALSIPVPLAEGAYDITVTVTDTAGNASSDTTAAELIIDLTAPVAPGVTSLASSEATPVIEGTATIALGETLTVELNGVIYAAGDGNLLDNGDGTWALTIPTANALIEDLYQVIATVTDTAGNSTVDPGVDDLLVDFTAPSTPGVTSLTTNNTTPILEGTATTAPGEILTVSVNGIPYTAGDGNLVNNNDGTWTLTIPVPLAEGIYDVTATITDVAGNTSVDPSSSELLIDTTLPITPTATPLTTNNASPLLVGTANAGPGETLNVTVDGVTYIAGDGNLVDNGDGTWALLIPTPLAEGTYDVTATVTDAAGNQSTDASSSELVIDTTTPAVPTANTLVTNINTPVLSGTTSSVAGESLTVTVNGITYSPGDGNLVVNGDDTWDLSIPVINAIAEGIYEVLATITDLAGNKSTDTSAAELTIDNTVPAVPTVTTQNTSNTTPTIAGTATVAADETLSVTVNGVTYIAGDGNLIDNGNGTWALLIPTPLAEGIYDVIATVTDNAGNATTDATVSELVIDTTTPVVPTVLSQNTSNTTPIITGTATVGLGETLNVTVDGVTYTAGDGNLVDNNDGTWKLTIPNALVDSTYPVTVTVLDAAGNTSDDATTSELIIDTTAPPVPTVASQFTSNTTPVIQGTATIALGETLTVIVDGITYIAGYGNLADNGNGTWSLSIPVPLADSTYEVIVTVTDAAGNATSDTTIAELIVDTTDPIVPTVTALTTNNTTPVISGMATVAADETLTITVDGVTYTAGDGNLIDNGDGTWDLSIPTPLAEGAYEVITTITDAAGNLSTDISADELIIDTTAPTTPTVTAQNTNSTSPTITGTATVAAGDTLTVTVDGVTYTAGDGHLVDNGDGTWALAIPVPLAEGTYDITVTVTDPAGNAASDTSIGELVIDLTAPVAPGVTSLATFNPTPVIEGTATISIGETLTVEVNGVTYTAGNGNLVDNGDGTWALTIPAANLLIENLYQVIATVTDSAGNSALDPGFDDLLVDYTAPTTPGVTSLTTNNTTPVLEGTAIVSAGETLTVTVNGITYTAGDGNLNDHTDGTWTLSIPVPLAEAIYNVTATIIDVAGNISVDPSSNELLIDTSLPITPTVTPQVTNNTTPVIEGTANVGLAESLSVTVDGVTYVAGDGNLIDNGDGTWALSIPTPLLEGTYNITATVTDAAGNQSTDTSNGELVIDTTNPVVPTINTLITNINTPVISGTTSAIAGESLTVTVNGISYMTGDGNLVVNTDGTWNLTIPADNAIAEGTYEVLATITDLAGNVITDTSAAELIIDTTVPVVPTVTTQNTSNTTPVIAGSATVAAGETLSVTVDGVTYVAGDGNLTDNGDGTWNLAIPNALTDSTYPVTVTVVDAASNSIDDVTISELIIDTTAPPIPTVIAQVTNNNTPVIQGTATVALGETLTVTVDGITFTAGDGNLIDNGNGTWALIIPVPLTDGAYDVMVTVTDGAGNATSDATTAELLIDTTDPVLPTVTDLSTSNTTPVISGAATVAAGETLTVTVDGVTYTAGDGNLINNGDGTWDLSIPTPLAEGTYEVIATITDTAGNLGIDVSANELIIDTTAPAAPTVTAQSTNSTSPTITGTATVAAGETLTVIVGGIVYVAGDGNLVDNGNGTWQLTIPTTGALTDATYNVTVTVTDTAGNSTTDSTSSELIIDLIAPIAPTVTAQTTNSTTPVISGTATVSPGETLTVVINGITYTAGDGNLADNGDGTWDLTIPQANALPVGPVEVQVTVTDAAGNSTSDNSNFELVIDLVAPIAPTVTAQTTNTGTPVISGNATVGAGETLTVVVNGVTYTAGDGNLVDNGDGTWDLTIPEANALPEGPVEVQVTVTDAAGNSTSDSSSMELIIDLTPPIAPTVIAQITNLTTPVVQGNATISIGETLSVEINGITYVVGDGNLFDNNDGSWTLVIPATDTLTNGTYDVTATLTDIAGNLISDSTAAELIVDTLAPAVPSVTPQTTSNSTPTISGFATVNPGDTLTVEINGVTYTAGDGNLTDNGDGTWDLNIPVTDALPDGSFNVTVTVGDPAGNSSSDTSESEIIIDTTPPPAPGVTSQTTMDATPIISGTTPNTLGDSTLILTVEVNGITYTESDGKLIDNGDGTWDLLIPDADSLAEQFYDVTATLTDLAGNSSIDPGSNELLVDQTAPATPGVTSLTTRDITPVISGTAILDTGDILTVEVNGITYAAGDGNLLTNTDGTWQLAIPLANALAENTYDVAATITDTAGNANTDPSVTELLVDLTSPNIPMASIQVSAIGTPTVSGTADLNAGEVLTVTINDVTYTEGDGNLVYNPDGTWTLDIPQSQALPDGVFTMQATITDTAGNTSINNLGETLTIDTSNPLLTAQTADDFQTNYPTFNGTSSEADGSIVIITDLDGNVLCTAIVVNGNWACTSIIALPEGVNDLIASITDPAGNRTEAPISAIISNDFDGDGIPNSVEGNGDSDGDGVSDLVDLDSDNDGIPDVNEGLVDTDADGVPNYLDPDSDNDGIPDTLEALGTDSDQNFSVDNFIDINKDGLSDPLQQTNAPILDTDFDGIPDYLDVDSDQDGIPDIIETDGTDADNNGLIDQFTDNNADGIDDSIFVLPTIPGDTDSDGIVDYLDTDSDNNGLSDLVEFGFEDNNNDNIVDSMADIDRDSIPDSVDVSQTLGADADNDGIDDRFDASILQLDDADNDGIADQWDPDADGDGFADTVVKGVSIVRALPDNGTEDLSEPDSGFVRTGLEGHAGCTIAISQSNKTDPTIPAMLLLSGLMVAVRRKKSRASLKVA